jgi:hypothetical protein
MKFMKAGVLFAASSLLIALPAFGLDLKPGKYEITAKVEMAGMPGGMPQVTSTQCLTKENPVPNGSADSQDCKVTDMKTDGNKITYAMECDQQGRKMTSSGEMIYEDGSFESTSTMKMGPSAGGMAIKSNITGKWVGECDDQH